ncbi:hypothetical protein C8Q76DRAFT_318178 [Earliella scabrosa]|nr:hypothetical protein C8Q76DRAFT_318178 [Earliella scabrosa]
MTIGRLPIEICEHIIDACWRSDVPRVFSYHVLRQTSLVCSAWLPRSQMNLLYQVELTKESHVDLLLRTLQETPHLADLVVRLVVKPVHKNAYIPFFRAPLPRLLKKCIALDFCQLTWTPYSPRYADLYFPYWSGIVELHITIPVANVLHSLWRFIWSLPKLSALHVRGMIDREDGWNRDMDAIRRAALQHTSKTRKCPNLIHLRFKDYLGALVPWKGVPFGSSVKRFEFDATKGISDDTLECIQHFQGLEHLAFRFNPYSEPKRSSQKRTNVWIAVLNRVRPSSALQTLSICVYRSFLHGEIRNGSDRIGLLDLLFGDEMPVIFSGFPELRQLHIILEDNDPEYDSGWWTAEVIRRLPPRCHATVSVEVELCSYKPHLWHSAEQIVGSLSLLSLSPNAHLPLS